MTDLGPLAIELLGLLNAGEYTQLDAKMSRAWQESVDLRSDRRLYTLIDLLGSVGPDNEPALGNWIAHSSRPVVAHTVRGMHRLARAAKVRGGRFAADTPEPRLAAMRALLLGAGTDFLSALALDAQFGPAHAGMLGVQRHQASPQLARRIALLPKALLVLADADFKRRHIASLLQVAVAHADSYAVQQATLFALQPRWGGSLRSLFEAASRIDPVGKPDDFVLLASYAACLGADNWRVADDELTSIGLHWAIADRFREAKHPACLLLQARAERDQRRVVAAGRLLRRYLQLIPHDAQASMSLARLQRASQDSAAAAETLDTALALRPNNPALLCERADLDRANGELRHALTMVESALGQNAWNDDCWLQRSRLLRALDRHQEADDALQHAEELAPNSDAIRLERATLALQAKDLKAVENLAGEIAARDPQQVAALFLKASAAREAQRGDEAEALLDRILNLDSDFAPAYFERGVVRYHLTEDVQGAREDLQRASALLPEIPDVWFELAGASYKLRDCGFVDAFRRYRALCAEQACPADRVAWSDRWLDDPGLANLCPGR